MASHLYDEVRKEKTLFNAWKVVYQNGISSKSKSTRDQVIKFDQNHIAELRKLGRKLRKREYKFSESFGVAKKKPGKDSKRPIVIAEVGDRVVQRAILDVLQSQEAISSYVGLNTSFGGLKDNGVRDAIAYVYASIQSGAKYFIKSDIESFFTKIPKSTIISILSDLLDDKDFISLFNDAINVELKNLATLGADSALFPLYDIGVAQGSCLSPLIGNILLHEFDVEMNKADIECIRYIDDFIILGPNQKAANAGFRRALTLLEKHGLSAYDPARNDDKADRGATSKMFEMLGCDIRPGMIKPNKKTKTRFIKTIEEILSDSSSSMEEPEKLMKSHLSVIETLNTVSNVKKGWGNQYSFCNDENEMIQLDRRINGLINKYLADYRVHRQKLLDEGKDENITRLLGIHSLLDRKKSPIIIS